MEITHFSPAQHGEFGYIIGKANANHEVTLARSPIIGYCSYFSETKNEEVMVFTLPVCSVGENRDPVFIQRYDGTFTDVNGEHQFYSLVEMMDHYGYEPNDPDALPPTNPKELSLYVWRPLRNPAD
ncbi:MULTISPECIES: hypothetical protein [Aeromonas]|uniref:hypothetical protein n=1 Tax=Aeromonas TaxID=642 RepID=UPI00125F80C0|nr:hypothetical protein [Aeromonas salmonicida]VXA79348.1 conserved hypothetical protein [Aeromonas salmonicida]